MKLKQLVQKLITPLHNCEAATIQLCKLLNVRVTKINLQRQLEEHPEYPSLLAINDILRDYGIENVSIRTEASTLCTLPTPMIAMIRIEKERFFAVIIKATENSVTYHHPVNNNLITVSVDDFDKTFSRIVLLAEAKENAGEKDYEQHLGEEQRQNITKISATAAIPIFTLLVCTFAFAKNGIASIAAITYTLLTLARTIVGSLLLWYEVDQHNPALQQICSAGKKTNCSAIVHSAASKIFGISWSVIGFTYFAGSLISLLVVGIYHLPTLFILSWINVLALPYIVFSVYYQARIAKQWCVLCLAVQGILALQFVTAFFGGFHTSISMDAISATVIFAIILSFIIPFLVVSLLLPALRKAKESRQHKMELQRLKHNPQIFDALLTKQKAITEPADGLGITIGKSDAKYKLIKVCNPYCGPCAKAHPAMDELIDNNPNVQVQVIFTATDNENDFKAPPVKHLLAIAEKDNEEQTKKALDEWYLA